MHAVVAEAVILKLWDALQRANPLHCGKAGELQHDRHGNQIIGHRLAATPLLDIGITENDGIPAPQHQFDEELYILTDDNTKDTAYHISDSNFAKNVAQKLAEYGIKLPENWFRKE